jgi:ADP-L-glycero-D-manno-heptose 6-epimerase
MKYLITGTNGFIGQNLYKEFNVDDVITINEDIFESTDWVNNLKLFLNDQNPDVIFHVGACSDTLESDVEYMMTRNYESTKILSDWSKEKSIPMIYSSSAACYGINGNYPSNLYGWSKYQAENYVIKNEGISLRYFNVYGFGEQKKGKMSSMVYQSWLFKQNNVSKFKIFPKKPTRDFVYVKDIINANLYAFNNYLKLKSKYYDVGSGQSRTFEDIMKILNISFDYTPVESIPNGYQFYTLSDKNKWMPGWIPVFNLEDGIDDYLNLLNNNRDISRL